MLHGDRAVEEFRGHLRALARHSDFDDRTTDALLELAAGVGFDMRKLARLAQNDDLSGIQRAALRALHAAHDEAHDHDEVRDHDHDEDVDFDFDHDHDHDEEHSDDDQD